MKKLLDTTDFPWFYVALVSVSTAVLMYAPLVITILLFLMILAMCLLEGMKLKLWMGFQQRPEIISYLGRPMVSVHLAICNEPAEMVIETLRGILSQNYGNFEIIVVDNNTSEEHLWRPVEEFCEARDNVRFFHLEHWPFYKSGALNFTRKVTHADAEFVFVVDADYRLTEDALEMAIAHLESESIALVQFPQAYQCENARHLPLLEEFDHFFDYYCSKADSCYGALATGTLSLIRISALDGVGGWPINSITEDAELGSRLQASGHDIKYVHRIIGKGMAPIHQRDFLKQRKRWIFGNVQTLLNYSLNPIQHFNKWLSGVSQLTAWINMLGLPILCLLACLLLFPWLPAEVFMQIGGLSYVAFWIFSISKVVQLQLVQKPRVQDAFRTFLIHFSSLDIGAFHWWPALMGRKLPFVRTDKSNAASGYRFNLFYPILHFCVFLFSLSYGSTFIALSALSFLMVHVLAMLLDYRCRADAVTPILFNLKLHL